jgi:hypothetical protein
MAVVEDVRFGNPDEWRSFRDRNPEFLARFGNLKRTLEAAFIRRLKDAGTLESLLFFTSRQAVDDFFEILVLSGNAEGPGAEKLLRSFFERVVLIRYLHKHPEKVDDYYDYYHVSMKRIIDSAIRFWGPEAFDQASIAETEAHDQRVKDKFKGRKCKMCGHSEMGIAWSSVALPDMAQDVGLGGFIFYAYTMPLLNAHPTVKGTLQRLEGEENGAIGFGDRINPELADRVLSTAHMLLLHVLFVQVERFPVDGLEAMVAQAEKDYAEIWKPRADSSGMG